MAVLNYVLNMAVIVVYEFNVNLRKVHEHDDVKEMFYHAINEGCTLIKSNVH